MPGARPESPFKEGVAQTLAPPSAERLSGRQRKRALELWRLRVRGAGLAGSRGPGGVPSGRTQAQVTRVPSRRGGAAGAGPAPRSLAETPRPPRAAPELRSGWLSGFHPGLHAREAAAGRRGPSVPHRSGWKRSPRRTGGQPVGPAPPRLLPSVPQPKGRRGKLGAPMCLAGCPGAALGTGGRSNPEFGCTRWACFKERAVLGYREWLQSLL